MTGSGHTLTGFVAGIPLAVLCYQNGAGVTGTIGCLAACVMGATAPDWLEVPYKSKQKGKNGTPQVVRKRLLKHRGVTHIITLWGMAFLWSFTYLKEGSDPLKFTEFSLLMISLLFGFFGGGVLHLLGDIPNKQKIPIFTPWDGIAFNLWKSGEYERVTGAILLILSLLFTFYESVVYGFIIRLIG